MLTQLRFFFNPKSKELFNAATCGDLKNTLKWIHSGAKLNLLHHGHSILTRVARSPHCSADVVRALLENGADVTLGLNPLIIAGHSSLDEIIILLIDYGAKINDTSPATPGKTPLQELISWADFKTVKYIIEHGADVNMPALNNWTYASHLAAALGRVDILELLFVNGADFTLKNNFGHNTLEVARLSLKAEKENHAPSLYTHKESVDYLQNLKVFE